MGVGMPAIVYLRDFGEHVRRAFGHVPYHVGSSLTEKSGWRDVDVRLILPDEEWADAGYGTPDREHDNAKWVSTVLAWSAFGKALTGLPVDFQIQQRTYANEKFNGPRSGLFSISLSHEFMKHGDYRAAKAVEHALKCQACGTAAFVPNDRCADHKPLAQEPCPGETEPTP